MAWGYFGIYQSLMAPEGFQGAYPSLAIAALVGMGLLIVMTGIQFYFNGFKLMPVVNADLS